MAIYLELPVYKACYELYMTFVKLRRTLPREDRYTLGQDIDRAIVDALVLLQRINSTREKVPLIVKARQLVAEVQIRIRALRDVRALSIGHFTTLFDLSESVSKQLVSWQKFSHRLLCDLYAAYLSARRQKRTKGYQLRFEMNQERELVRLRDELISRRYAPKPFSSFIVHDPKMREVFAAEFRDRVVHHLFYNYTHEVFERSFIADSYSCIERRGTHYGIERLKHHIRSCSQNWTKPCFVLKLDVRGYFMHIRRDILVRTFLRERFKLDLSENKTRICDVHHGVEFLGAFIKPYRTYVSSKSMRRICKHIHSVSTRMDRARAQAVVNSSLGVLSHYDSHNMRQVLIERSSA